MLTLKTPSKMLNEHLFTDLSRLRDVTCASRHYRNAPILEPVLSFNPCGFRAAGMENQSTASAVNPPVKPAVNPAKLHSMTRLSPIHDLTDLCPRRHADRLTDHSVRCVYIPGMVRWDTRRG